MTASSGIRFLPWIGDQYFKSGFGGYKILLLGESHYSDTPDDRDNPELTRMIVAHYALGPKPHRYFSILSALVAGAARPRNLTPAQQGHIWQSLCFYNYVQDLLPVARRRPSPDMWKNAAQPFAEILGELRPDILLVAGKQLSWHIPALPEYIAALHITHPSAFGFSYTSALAALNGQLPGGFTEARNAFMTDIAEG